jgi:phosphoribosyl-AMP cyclohydrolase
MAITYTLISTTTTSSTVNEVTISSIPQTYNDLVLRIVSKSGVGSTLSQIYCQFSGSTASIYRSKGMYWYGSGAANIETLAETADAGRLMYQGTSSGNAQPGMGVFYINNYASTSVTKSAIGLTTQVQTGGINYFSKTSQVLWNSAGTAITSIRLFASGSDNILAGATFKLYGIKNT